MAVSTGDFAPTLVLDAGTGLRHLGGLLEGGGVFEGTILLTHLHWDHTHGLPFSPPIDNPDSHVRLLVPDQDGDPRLVLERAMSPPHFPITPGELGGIDDIDFIVPGGHRIGRFDVVTAAVDHKGGATFGYRVSAGGASLGYLPDHSVGADDAIDLVRGVDLLIHDAMYTAAEQEKRASFGHCSIDEAIELAEASEVGGLILFHHDFNRTDDELDALIADLSDAPFPVTAARQGATYEITSGESVR